MYCIHYYEGQHNVTGNESCISPESLEKCEFSINRYFIDAKLYTVAIVLSNEVNKIVYPVVVTVYEGKFGLFRYIIRFHCGNIQHGDIDWCLDVHQQREVASGLAHSSLIGFHYKRESSSTGKIKQAAESQ